MDPTDRPKEPVREPGVSPGGDRPQPDVGREASDVSIPAIVKFGIGLALAAVVIYVAMWGLFRMFDKREQKKDVVVPPMVAASLQRTPREPRLEPDPLAPRLALQSREKTVLGSYGWVDRGAGIGRIPIDRAMELLVEKGLPPAKVVTPVPTPRKRETGSE